MFYSLLDPFLTCRFCHCTRINFRSACLKNSMSTKHNMYIMIVILSKYLIITTFKSPFNVLR